MGERLQSPKSYVCSFFDCKAKFSKSWKLEAHLCKHTGLKPFPCESCDKCFCTRYQLTRHELTHSGEKPHKCSTDGCSEAFVTNASLKNHMARVHQHKEKRYQCDHKGCGKIFNKKYHLKGHKSEHGQLLFLCTFSKCSREFPTKGKLKHHEKVHKGYPCESEACPFLGRTWTEYQKHRKSHRVKLSCTSCKRCFSNAWFLNAHKRSVHSGRPKRTLTCPRQGCGKKFTRGFHLESHVLGDHEKKRPFGCVHAGCGKSFAMKESLWRHGVAHDPKKKKLKKRHPKKSWREAQRARMAAAANQADANKLAAKLSATTLKDKKT